jgi:drug/metabolite transporter (DMT)-like permease
VPPPAAGPPTPEAPKEVGLGIGASTLSAIGWGFSGVFAALAWTPPVVLTFYRMTFAAALLSAIALARGRRIDWRALRIAAPGGILLVADLILFYAAVRLTRVAIATVIGVLQPALILMTAGRLFGEKVDRARVIGTVVAVAGVAIIVDGGGSPGPHELLGDLLAACSLLAWSGYFIASKWARPHVDALVYTAGVSIVGVVIALPAVFVAGQTLTKVRAGDWTWIVLLAVVPGAAHFFMNWAHQHLDASVSSVIVSGNPIVAAIAAWIILGQGLSALQMLGGLVGIAAIAFVAAWGGPAARRIRSPRDQATVPGGPAARRIRSPRAGATVPGGRPRR